MTFKPSFAITDLNLIDPYRKTSGTHHLVIEDGVLTRLSRKISDVKNFEGPQISGKGLTVCPGFCDPHVHLRDPGSWEKETIESGAKAAAAGGFTDIACMANTQPVNDNVTTLGYIQYKASRVDIRIHPICAVTQNLQGESLVAFEQLLKEGAIAFSDDGHILSNEKVLYQAMTRLAELDALLIGHCETASLSSGTCVNLGQCSFELGMDGNPDFSEGLSVLTHLYLAEKTKCRIHIAHLSTQAAVEWVVAFRKRGVKLSCEVTPHHLLLTDEKVLTGDGRYIVAPPLRSTQDQKALQKALRDGVIDCIATDHAPHTDTEKALGLGGAPPGMIGLETTLPVLWHLVKKKVITAEQLLSRLIKSPRDILRLPANPIKEGVPADLVFFQETKPHVLQKKDLCSKSSNNPFLGTEGLVRIHATLAKGKLAHVTGPAFKNLR